MPPGLPHRPPLAHATVAVAAFRARGRIGPSRYGTPRRGAARNGSPCGACRPLMGQGHEFLVRLRMSCATGSGCSCAIPGWYLAGHRGAWRPHHGAFYVSTATTLMRVAAGPAGSADAQLIQLLAQNSSTSAIGSGWNWFRPAAQGQRPGHGGQPRRPRGGAEHHGGLAGLAGGRHRAAECDGTDRAASERPQR